MLLRQVMLHQAAAIQETFEARVLMACARAIRSEKRQSLKTTPLMRLPSLVAVTPRQAQCRLANPLPIHLQSHISLPEREQGQEQ